MHDGINSGGDSWLWLACMSGAVPWERAGAGALKDARAMRRTLEYAVQKGFVGAEVLGPKIKIEPSIRIVSLDDMTGTVGVDEDGAIKKVAYDAEKGTKKLEWLSDCAVASTLKHLLTTLQNLPSEAWVQRTSERYVLP